MAIVNGPAMSLEASGNLGSICYTRSRGVQIARSTWSGTYPNTSLQQASNANMTTVSQYWGGTLSSDQRNRWKEAAAEIVWVNRLGQKFRPTGYNYFVKLALQQVQLGLSISAEPPGAVPGYEIHDFYVSNSGVFNAVIVKMYKFPNDQIDYEGFQIFRAGPYDTDSLTPQWPAYKFLAVKDDGRTYYDYSVTEGKYYFYRARWYELTGQVGNFWEGHVLVDFPG